LDEDRSRLGARDFAQEIGRPAANLLASFPAATSRRSIKIPTDSSERNPLRSPQSKP
jgi:hypothetical protein